MSTDESFRFDTATRARIAPEYDADALERLLQHFQPAERPILLDEFLLSEFRTYGPGPNAWRVLTGFTDARLNELLAEVCQPFWHRHPDELFNEADTQYPGRELARRRRGCDV